MSFGRNKNVVRRAMRPDESFHRDRRRRRIDRSAMLENHRRPGVLKAILSSLARVFRFK